MTAPNTLLGKVMLVLHAFGADDEQVGFAELQQRTDLPKATLHRLLGDLADARLIDRDPGGYRLGGHLFELGMRASVERKLIEVATPFLEDLYERTHETVHLGIRDGHEVVYVAKLAGHQQAASPSRLGGRLPLHATAIGKVLLAHAPPEVQNEILSGKLERRAARTLVTPGALTRQLVQVVETGVAYEFEESQVGLVCVAGPIRSHGSRVVAAVSVAGPVTRFHPQTHAASVRAAAAGISEALKSRQ
ncbi:IclR family transcriptional regulator [Kribbella antibiotica]|uniref:IclR family transcriptional regulator n=1 Tax=Kribbella antibiotica TaxID=190195 RepID=A0A4V2YQE6_9ACTN|nr:IclR family transcriptional regulator [Kribbella antibiotica]TDD61667.1 IclR family transcriptional regulator [Kribbella antibiotica]